MIVLILITEFVKAVWSVLIGANDEDDQAAGVDLLNDDDSVDHELSDMAEWLIFTRGRD